MDDLANRIQALSNLARIPMIEAMVRIDTDAGARARRGIRARRGTVDRDRAETARSNSARLGQIINFLRFRSPVAIISAVDKELCEMLERKLKAKNDWTGEICN